ncbi:MAG: hypothetical protein ACOYYS_11310 [Chloroflexota bacterium]
MHNSSHTHWLSLSWWFGYLSLGIFALFIVIGTIVLNASDLFANAGVLDYLGVLVLIAIVLPISLVLLARPFLTRIIVDEQGIEYHSTFFVIQANWKELVNIGYIKDTNAGKTLVVIPREGKLIHRRWSKPFRNMLKEYPNELRDVQILVSQFRDQDGHSFETDILVNVAQREGLQEG